MNDAPRHADSVPLVIATMLREEGRTGVHTHARQLRRYLAECGSPAAIITPFSWSRTLAVPVFGFRFPVKLCSKSAGVAWYRHWHAVFLTRALRRSLAEIGDCVIYAQDPLAARSALQARQGPHQRVALAVHFRISQSDEWADKHQIERDGSVYRAIRELEREVIPQVDGMVFVSEWARNALLDWLPEAASVPYAVIDNFVAPHPAPLDRTPLADLVTVGHLEPVKNHRYMLQILAAAKQAGRDVSLDIFGDGPLKRDLVGLTHSLGLDEQVCFRGFRTDLRDFLPRYKTYAHTSYSESSSLAIIEAMAAGLPILVGAIGPLAELCDDGVEARFWPLDDPARAAAILMEMLDDEPARLAASHAATQRFKRDFDAEVIAPRLRSFLLGLHPGRLRDAGGSQSPKAGRR
jgi:glycosyltransferase involved in cell wall biosynthesis